MMYTTICQYMRFYSNNVHQRKLCVIYKVYAMQENNRHIMVL